MVVHLLDKNRRDIQVKAHDILNGNESEQDKANALNILKEEYDAKDNELAVIQDNIKLVALTVEVNLPVPVTSKL